jgi:hypothetical protein
VVFKRTWSDLKVIILIAIILTPTPLQSFSLQSQSNEIFINDQNILWLFISNATPIQKTIKSLKVMYSFGKVDSILSIYSNMQNNISFNVNIAINFIGRERLHYILTAVTYNPSSITIKESVEGTLVIDWKSIVIQWHKYEVTAPNLYTISSPMWVPLKPFLNELINNRLYNAGNVVKDGNGIYILTTQDGKLISTINLIDVYLNKSSYLNYYLREVKECDTIDYLPMKTDIRINVNTYKELMNYSIHVSGLTASDPLDSYRAIPCLLPSLVLVQNIAKRIEANVTKIPISIPRISDKILRNILPSFLNTFVSRILEGYSRVFLLQNKYTNIIFVSAFNSTDIGYAIMLSIYNMNLTYTNDVNVYKNWLCNISSYMVTPYIGGDFCKTLQEAIVHINVTGFSQSSASNKLNETLIQLLVVTIVMVSIETGIVIYIVLNVLKRRA